MDLVEKNIESLLSSNEDNNSSLKKGSVIYKTLGFLAKGKDFATIYNNVSVFVKKLYSQNIIDNDSVNYCALNREHIDYSISNPLSELYFEISKDSYRMFDFLAKKAIRNKLIFIACCFENYLATKDERFKNTIYYFTAKKVALNNKGLESMFKYLSEMGASDKEASHFFSKANQILNT